MISDKIRTTLIKHVSLFLRFFSFYRNYYKTIASTLKVFVFVFAISSPFRNKNFIIKLMIKIKFHKNLKINICILLYNKNNLYLPW